MPFQFRKEAIEEDLNSNFPSQGQGNPPLYYSLSEVVVPTYSINSVAEGSGLPENLQTAWDFSTGSSSVQNTSTTIINNPGFWQIDLTLTAYAAVGASAGNFTVDISDGVTSKAVWSFEQLSGGAANQELTVEERFTVFLRSGDSVVVVAPDSTGIFNVWYRQIATVNGQLVNPLGFSAA